MWEFDLTTSWATYQEWVANRLPDFKEVRSTERLLVFSRLLEGDAYTIRLEVVQQGPPTRVRGTFVAQPW